MLHVTTGGRIGGAERLLIDVLVAGHAEQLFSAKVSILGRGEDLSVELRRAGIPVFAYGARGPAGMVLALARLTAEIRRGRYDVVHAHLIHGGAVGMLAARFGRARAAVLTRHYERFVWLYGTRLERALHIVGHRLADHICAISEAARSVMLDREGVRSDRVSVVPNGTDVARVRSQASATDGLVDVHLSPGDVVVGSVGSLHPRKGHADLIRALALMEHRSRVRCVLIGDGPALAQLQELAVELDLAERVSFLGYQAQPYPIIQSFDVYVQPSHEEGFGVAVLEAMALGRPVVATAVGGLPEIITAPSLGVLVPVSDVTGLAAALDRLVGDPGLRDRLGRAGSAHVASCFSSASTARGYSDVYRALLSRLSA